MAFPLGQWLSGPLVQGLFGLHSIRQQNRQQTQYQADVDRQIADAMRVAGQVGPQTLSTYDASAQPQLMELLGLRPRQLRGAQNIVSGYQDRYNTARDDLKGYGQQMARDIDTGFASQLASELASNQERGIASTTAQGSARVRNETARTSAQRRLGEDLQRMRLSILPQLSGDVLGARAGALDLDRLLTGDIGNFYGQNAANRSNIVGRGWDTVLNTIMNINRVPPPQNPYPGAIGQGLVDPVDYSKGQSSSAPWISAAGSLGGAAIAATIFVGICIADDSEIETPDGTKTLRDIKVGDVVTNADGEYREVIAKHMTAHSGDWQYHFRTADFGENRQIVASREHPIEGKTIEAWIGDQSGRCTILPPGPRKMVGDILLEDGSDYVANGLRVSSIISHEDIDALRVMEPHNQ